MAIQVPKTVAQLIRADAPASAARTALGLGSVATHDATEFAAAAGSTSIVTVGTVTAGTWHGTTIGVAYGGTGLATIASGKLLYASALDTLAALTLGTSLGVSGGTIDVQANTVNQKVIVSKAGTTIGTRKQINFIEGSNSTLTVADNPGSDRVDVTVAASGGGGLTVGGAVSGGGANRVLYEDASQNLAAAAGFTYDGTKLTVPKVALSSDGAANAPSLYFATDASCGFWLNGSGNFVLSVSNVARVQANGAAWRMLNSWVLNWASGDPTTTGADIGLARNAAGILEVNSGSVGTFRQLQASGFAEGYATKTAAYTLTQNDGLVACDATSAAFAVTLPSAAATLAGRIFRVKKTDSSGNAVTLTRAGSDTIDGATTYALSAQYKFIAVECDGVSAWWIVASN